MRTDPPAVTFDGTHLTHIYNNGRREDVPKAARPCRVCATIILYDIDPRHIGFSRLLRSTDAGRTTEPSIRSPWLGLPTDSERAFRAAIFEFEWQDDFAAASHLTIDRVRPTATE